MLRIYHNGECSKCRGALEQIQEAGIPHELRWYLAEPLSADELRRLLEKLKLSAGELVRTGEAYFQEHLRDKERTEAEWLELLVEHPELMQRPIVENANNAVIARPPERWRELL